MRFTSGSAVKIIRRKLARMILGALVAVPALAFAQSRDVSGGIVIPKIGERRILNVCVRPWPSSTECVTARSRGVLYSLPTAKLRDVPLSRRILVEGVVAETPLACPGLSFDVISIRGFSGACRADRSGPVPPKAP